MTKMNATRLVVICVTTILFACCVGKGDARDNATLEQRVKRIMTHPEFGHSRFGIKFISADSVNMFSVPRNDADAAVKIAVEPLGEIAAAAYDAMPFVQATQSASNDYDVIIKHGSIIDGTGSPWVSGDIGIRGDSIAAIGKLDLTLVPSA